MRAQMTTSDSSAGQLLGWLGRLKGAGEATTSDADKPELHKQARRHLLETISDFLLDNDLAVSPENLLAAHSAFAGGNPRLARQIVARLHAGDTITQDWLDEITAHNAAEQGEEAIQQLIGKLEKNLDAFAKSSRAARTATSDYNDKLEQHVVELEQVQETGKIISSLADLAKAMAERTRKVEQEMRKS